MKRLLATTAIVCGALWFHPPTAHATLLDFGLNLGGGDLHATTHNFVSHGLILGAATQGIGAGNLFLKCCAVGETGLGLTGDPSGEDEIYFESVKKNQQPDYIELDFSKLIGKISNASVQFGVDSVQAGESWAIYASNVADQGTNGTLVDSGNSSDLTANLPSVGTYDFYDFVATNANFLITDITATAPDAVPEPMSIALLGFGLLGTLAVAKRKRG